MTNAMLRTISEKTPQWYIDNREYCIQWRKEYYQRNKAAHRERVRKYWAKNRDRLKAIANAHATARRKNSPAHKLKHNLRALLRQSRGGVSYKRPFNEIVGCEPQELVLSFESQFRPGMTWQNHGSAWHIDHIIPQSAFDLFDPEQILTCYNYSNLQPLWAADNKRKGGIANVNVQL